MQPLARTIVEVWASLFSRATVLFTMPSIKIPVAVQLTLIAVGLLTVPYLLSRPLQKAMITDGFLVESSRVQIGRLEIKVFDYSWPAARNDD